MKFCLPKGFLQTAWETQEKAFQLIGEQHLEQLPMHEFLVRIRAQLVLWAWARARLDEAMTSARSGIEVLSSYPATATASVPGNVDSMLAGPW